MHGTTKRARARIEQRPEADQDASAPGRDALLAGLIIDARGTAMIPSRAASISSATARYYIAAIPAPIGAPERIPANRLDGSVITLLRRIRLLGDEWHRDDLTTILRRVVVLADAIVLHLDKRHSIATWREQEPMLQRLASNDVLRLVSSCLSKDEKISEAGSTLCLTVPRHSRARKIRIREDLSALLFPADNAAMSRKPPVKHRTYSSSEKP